MNKKSVEHGDMIKGIVEQYKESMRTLIREGKFNHKSLEQQLSHVVDSVNEEIRKMTIDLIAEEEEGAKKKRTPAPAAEKKPE